MLTGFELLVKFTLLVGSILSAAKLHGRQIRLEREQRGYFNVFFGGENEPYIVELWRKDARLLKAVTFAGIGLAVVATCFYRSLGLLFFGSGYAFIGGFLVSTLASTRRLFHDLKMPHSSPPEDEKWVSLAETIAWWTLTFVLILASFLLISRLANALQYLKEGWDAMEEQTQYRIPHTVFG